MCNSVHKLHKKTYTNCVKIKSTQIVNEFANCTMLLKFKKQNINCSKEFTFFKKYIHFTNTYTISTKRTIQIVENNTQNAQSEQVIQGSTKSLTICTQIL